MTAAALAPLLTTIALVALGGALGAVARVRLTACVGNWVAQRRGAANVAQATMSRGTPLPIGTIIVNLSGALAIGLVAGSGALGAGSFTGDALASAGWALGVTGFLGSFTTVSSLALQTLELADTGHTGRAAFNLCVTLVAGIAAVTLGYAAGTQLWGPQLWGAA
ncbi:fluoride efflux transporter FluC [Roseicitreum antarcticum]|nr:CrcB family protein [Roseicitreum antarcticum]